MSIRDVGKILGLTSDQIRLIDQANAALDTVDGFYIPHTPKWQKLAKGLVLEGYLERDHNIDDTPDIAVRFTIDCARRMVNEAKSRQGD